MYSYTKCVDRLVTGTDELLECKTCSLFKKDEWENDEIPQEYILQVIWYLGITGRKKGYIAVLIGGQSFKWKEIEFDKELFDQMVETAKEFWNCVQNDIPPAIMADDDDTLKELYAINSETMIELMPTDEEKAAAVENFETAVAHRQELSSQKTDIEAEIKELDAKIKAVIKDNLGIKTPKYKITWKSQTKSGFDTKTFKAEKPEEYDKYKTETSYRVLRIAKNKDFEVA